MSECGWCKKKAKDEITLLKYKNRDDLLICNACHSKKMEGYKDKCYLSFSNPEFRSHHSQEFVKVKNDPYYFVCTDCAKDGYDYMGDQGYYRRNKEKILAKVKCECGAEVSKGWLSGHRKSQAHQDWELTQSLKSIKL